jgi:hypothetical protein
MCNGNCKCAKQNHPAQGKPTSLTSIAFNTGRLLEKRRILKILTERYDDLIACNKQDDCQAMAIIVASCIADIEDKEGK